jgi:Ca2+-binding RTX toxin-like protein
MVAPLSQDLWVSPGTVMNLVVTSYTDFGLSCGMLVGAFDGTVGQIPYDPSIYNYGEIRLVGPSDGGVLIAYNTGANHWAGAVLENHGLISAVLPDAIVATAIGLGDVAPAIYNSGRIEAQARIQAMGIGGSDGSLVITNADTGVIDVTSREAPTAIRLLNSGTILNQGQILAHALAGGRDGLADNGIAISLGPGGGAIFETRIVNDGLIQASDTNAATERSMAIYLLGNARGEIVNSGTIRGDYAIREQAEPRYNEMMGMIVRNSGLIEGRVVLDTGNDLIDNRGRILGEISLGIGGDLFYSAAGTVEGTVRGGDGSDMLIGSVATDMLSGDAGDDLILGGGGADQLSGGAGGDVFVYTAIGDSTAADFDVLADFVTASDRIDLTALAVQSVSIEAGSGFSLLHAVTAAGTLTIRVNGALAQSDLILAGSSAIGGTANADLLHATAGGSALAGGDGNDVLVGAAGNDRLDGGPGSDVLWGGTGDDVYVVDHHEDQIWELAGEGYDRVEIGAAGYFTMTDNLEELSASHSIRIYGSSLANLIFGSSGSDTLFGGGGADEIRGGGGGDEIQGDGGGDRLTGGDGADTFIFATIEDCRPEALNSNGAKSVPDRILDFTAGTDRIDLSPIDAIANGGPLGVYDAFIFIGTEAFTGQAGQLRYEVRSGLAHIFGDVDGNGIADFEIVATAPLLQASDFIL